MRCLKCQFENREGVKFCEKCGAKMEMECPRCKAKIPPDRQFCHECGYQFGLAVEATPLDYSAPQSYTPRYLADQILTSRSALEGERKLVTVLFADVASYTSLSEKLDPEEVHQILDGCFQILMEKIHQYEGTINQFTGDGVMALFGAPLAHEDHAQRACHAALAIQKALSSYGEKIQKEYSLPFKLRIGLNSGPVVVGKIGDDLRMDYTAIGDTTNLASRLQSLAQPGTILASQHTQHLAQDFFSFQPLGKIEVKGKEEPQQAYQLLKESEVETRIEASVAKGLTRFVGRTREIQSLQEAYAKIQSGSGQVVGIVGEAGVGKSRLLWEFRSLLPAGESLCLQGHCLHYGGSMAYLPILDILRSYFGIKEGDREIPIKKKLSEKVLSLDSALQDILSPLQEIFSLKVDDESFLQLEPRQKRERTFEALRDLLIRQSQGRPLILAIEDLQWVDKTSEEFLSYLIDWLAKAQILLVLLYRPEYTHLWGSKSHYTKIGLDQLSLNLSAELVQAILEGGEVAPELRQLLLDRAAGNPLFLEELTHSLLENGSILKQDHRFILSQKPSDLQVPDTIQGIVAARMDRLEENLKRTMQFASVIGRDFAFRILQMITGMREDLKAHLLNLQGLEFIYEKSLFPELEYLFKHALTQEVAYQSLLLKRRKEIHERIGQAIEQLYPERLEEFYEVLAFHFEKAGVTEKAVKYLHRAGERAARLYANEEAIVCFNRALELLQTLPESADRDQQELALQLGLYGPLAAARSWAAPGVGTACTRALELCRQRGETSLTCQALALLQSYYMTRANYQTALELSEEILQMAQHTGDSKDLLQAHRIIGTSLQWVGSFQKAQFHLEQAISLYDPEQCRPLLSRWGIDLGCHALNYLARNLWFLGYPDQAIKRAQESLELAQELDHPFSLVFAMLNCAKLHRFRREPQVAQKYAKQGLDIAREGGFTALQAWGSHELGWIQCMLGEADEGIARMQKGLEIWRAEGMELSVPEFLVAQAEGHQAAGQVENGLRLVEEALALMERTEERWFNAEAYRVQGDLLQPSGRTSEAEEAFRQAIEVARHQEAKSWELRATLSLSRLLQQDGRSAEARQLLSEVYGWFTEGFDTPDLQETRALLDAPEISL